MRIAEKFSRPVFAFVDLTSTELRDSARKSARSQAEAIALDTRDMARLRVPIITTITGEAAAAARWQSQFPTAF